MAEAAVWLISMPDGTLVTVTSIDPWSSPTSSSTVAISSATVASPAPNVTDVGLAPLMKLPSCVTETFTVSAAAAEPVRLSVNAAASPSFTESASAAIETVGGPDLTVTARPVKPSAALPGASVRKSVSGLV